MEGRGARTEGGGREQRKKGGRRRGKEEGEGRERGVEKKRGSRGRGKGSSDVVEGKGSWGSNLENSKTSKEWMGWRRPDGRCGGGVGRREIWRAVEETRCLGVGRPGRNGVGAEGKPKKYWERVGTKSKG